jgi:hypothetical protein
MSDFMNALRRACIDRPIEFLGLIATIAGVTVAIIGVIAALISIYFLNQQLAGIKEGLDSQAYNYIWYYQIELDKIFVEHSDYRPYFYDDKPLPAATPGEENKERQKILELAGMMLDVFDSFHSQTEHIDWTRYSLPAWAAYHHDSFERSRVLCEVICKDWSEYGKDIRKVAAGACKRIKEMKLSDPEDPKDPNSVAKKCEWMP